MSAQSIPAVRRHCNSVYRLTLSDTRFGQVQRNTDDLWMAEIRDIDSGSLLRYAGLWKTRREAIDELAGINPLDL